jgi:4-hydroxy-tetrahydrodipicolinate synthase
MGAIHGKDTKRSIDDARRAQDLGAVGLQVSAPIYNDPTQDDILRYFDALSSAIEIGIMVYNTPWMPHGGIETSTFHRMADFEHVVAIKWCNFPGYDYEDLTGLTGVFNILDNSNQPGRCYKLGGHGFLDEQATAYPPHELKVLELLESGRHDEGQALWDSVSGPIGKFYARLAGKSGGAARVKKGVLSLMGHPVGSMRPPSEPLSREEMAELRRLLVGLGWPVPEVSRAVSVTA